MYVELLSPSGLQLVNPSGSDIYIRRIPIPGNVRARNVGNGSLEVEWDADGIIGVDIDHYDVYIATSLTGPYSKANFRPITNNKAIIPNIPYNTIVYAKVTETPVGGSEGAMSDPANDGYCVRSTIALTFTAPVGDSVPFAAMFAEYVGDGNVIAFRTTASGQF